jgi:hypothetical protein
MMGIREKVLGPNSTTIVYQKIPSVLFHAQSHMITKRNMRDPAPVKGSVHCGGLLWLRGLPSLQSVVLRSHTEQDCQRDVFESRSGSVVTQTILVQDTRGIAPCPNLGTPLLPVDISHMHVS